MRTRRKIIGAALAGAAVVLACGWACTHKSKADIRELEAGIQRDGIFAFHEKTAGELDSGRDVAFLPAGRVHVVEYGNALRDYEGTYNISADGLIHFSVKDRVGQPLNLVSLVLMQDMRSFILQSADVSKSAWTSRQAAPDDVVWIRRRIKEWAPIDVDAGL